MRSIRSSSRVVTVCSFRFPSTAEAAVCTPSSRGARRDSPELTFLALVCFLGCVGVAARDDVGSCVNFSGIIDDPSATPCDASTPASALRSPSAAACGAVRSFPPFRPCSFPIAPARASSGRDMERSTERRSSSPRAVVSGFDEDVLRAGGVERGAGALWCASAASFGAAGRRSRTGSLFGIPIGERVATPPEESATFGLAVELDSAPVLLGFPADFSAGFGFTIGACHSRIIASTSARGCAKVRREDVMI